MAVVMKPKRRNSEKRKEKSRDAARSRRSKETEVFCQLAHELPVSYNVLAQLDKASVVRLGITHLKLRKLFDNAAFEKSVAGPSSVLQQRADHLFCRALDGFLLLANKDGSVVYITENVISVLGLTQMDLLGHSVYDFIHPCDHDEMQDVISNRNGGGDGKNLEHSLFLRMKCTLTSKGRSVNVKSAGYKVIHCTGSTMSKDQQQLEPLNLTKGEAGDTAFTLLMCHPIPNPSTTDILLDSGTFVSHHNMDMTFVSCDERISNLLGFKPEQLIGRSLYDYHHALDSEALEKSFRTLFTKGQCITGLYRFLAKSGGYVWVETQSSIINSPRTEKAQSVVCINLVVSGVECGDQIFSTVQQQGSYLEADESKKMPMAEEEEVEEVDIEEEGEEEEEEEEEMDESKEEMEDDGEDAMFVTEQILTMARKEYSLPCKRGLLDAHASGDNSLSLFKPQAPDVGRDVYEQIAPFISLDDTVFDSVVPSPTRNATESSFDQSFIDPNLDRNCILRQPKTLQTSFNDMANPAEKSGAGDMAMNELPWSKDVASILASLPSANSKVTREFLEEPGNFFPDRQHQVFGVQKLIQSDAVSALNGSSVLKNLLIKGVDVNYGYRLVESSSDDGVVPHKASYSENGSTNKASFSSVLHQLLCVQGNSS